MLPVHAGAGGWVVGAAVGGGAGWEVVGAAVGAGVPVGAGLGWPATGAGEAPPDDGERLGAPPLLGSAVAEPAVGRAEVGAPVVGVDPLTAPAPVAGFVDAVPSREPGTGAMAPSGSLVAVAAASTGRIDPGGTVAGSATT